MWTSGDISMPVSNTGPGGLFLSTWHWRRVRLGLYGVVWSFGQLLEDFLRRIVAWTCRVENVYTKQLTQRIFMSPGS